MPNAPLPIISTTKTVDWRFWLCNSSDMSQIAELSTAHDRSVQFQLNSGGKSTFWLHPLDPLTADLVVHQTALRCDRNGRSVWSGPIYNIDDAAGKSSNRVAVTAMGWQKILDQRLLHTGAEFQVMLAAWQAATGGSYTSLGVDVATQLAYSVTNNPQTSDAAIVLDLLQRANIDSPTYIVPGATYGSPPQRNLTLTQFAKVGQQIQNLLNVEDGSDVYVDPVTRQMNLFGAGSSSSPLIPNGMGYVRPSVVFTFPGNCVDVTRSHDGTKTANRIEAQGQYGVGRADATGAQGQEGLFEDVVSLSNVVDPNILIAFANAEVTYRQYPWTIIGFTPRALGPTDQNVAGVPRPFDDFFLGDLVGCVVNYGPRLKIGTAGTPQNIRVYGFQVDIDDGGTERLSNIQTTYSGLGASTG